MKKFLMVTVLLMFLGISHGYARSRYALVIGIGEYEDSRWGSIHADTDVDYVVRMLHDNGFEEIRTLRNAEATRQAIVSAFNSLAQSCKAGDKVYIHFSGHGQQITDLDGDEEDGYDEAWIPYDAHPYYCASYRGENHLVDDEVNRMLSLIRDKVGIAGRIVVVADACCSGGVTRCSADNVVSRGFNKRFEIPCGKPGKKKATPEDWITISACKSYQVNWEMSEPAVGKLTWCLYSLRDKLCSMSNKELKKSIIRIMQDNPGPLEQTPDITGNTLSEAVMDIFQR